MIPLIYTTSYMRVPDRHQYDLWLSSSNDGDEVTIQSFVPATRGFCTLPYERWNFTLCKLNGSFVSSQSQSDCYVNRITGKLHYPNSTLTECGDVFPSRIVPSLRERLLKEYKEYLREPGDSIYGHAPVYEPLYSKRLVFFVQHGQHIQHALQLIRATYGRLYTLDVYDGRLVHCFPDCLEGDNDVQELLQHDSTGLIRFLYADSQFI